MYGDFFDDYLWAESMGMGPEDPWSWYDDRDFEWLTLKYTDPLRETAKAVMWSFGGTPVWLPKSKVRVIGPHTTRVQRWLVEKKGLQSHVDLTDQ